jgi:hypothetical protein
MMVEAAGSYPSKPRAADLNIRDVSGDAGIYRPSQHLERARAATSPFLPEQAGRKKGVRLAAGRFGFGRGSRRVVNRDPSTTYATPVAATSSTPAGLGTSMKLGPGEQI